MDAYGVAEVQARFDRGEMGVYFWCTEVLGAKEILAELQQVFFWSKVEDHYIFSMSGHVERPEWRPPVACWSWKIHKNMDLEPYIFSWLVQQLCERGWEPFASNGLIRNQTTGDWTISLRKKIQR
jgi:hypothetical protein